MYFTRFIEALRRSNLGMWLIDWYKHYLMTNVTVGVISVQAFLSCTTCAATLITCVRIQQVLCCKYLL